MTPGHPQGEHAPCILVAAADPAPLAGPGRALARAGYVVVHASSFAGARRQLVIARPDVLIASIRLAGYNGLHLVIGSRPRVPDLVAIVTHIGPDAGLQ